MSKKTKTYERVIFTPEVIKESVDLFETFLKWTSRKQSRASLVIHLLSGETWEYDSEDEFFAEYHKGTENANFGKYYALDEYITFWVRGKDTSVDVSFTFNSRDKIEKIFNLLESKVEECSLPQEPRESPKTKTDWIIENINKIDNYNRIVGRKLKLAHIKLESDEAEDWQSACMLVRDAWIELVDKLCKLSNIDTSDIKVDSVVERLRRLKVDKTDEKLFNLVRDSFNLAFKHHKRSIEKDTAVACVVSSIVSMRTVIQEVLNATG